MYAVAAAYEGLLTTWCVHQDQLTLVDRSGCALLDFVFPFLFLCYTWSYLQGLGVGLEFLQMQLAPFFLFNVQGNYPSKVPNLVLF